MIRLDIGCGSECQEGHLGVDLYYEDAPVNAPMWDLPFKDDSVDEIFSSHALEHVAEVQVIPTLEEWKRVIKPGGKITIRVPDLIWVCENFLKDPVRGWRLATVFGTQAHEGEFHKTGFTREWMVEHYLPEAGLKLEKYEELETHGQRTLSFEVTK